jgi:hypothetical protein
MRELGHDQRLADESPSVSGLAAIAQLFNSDFSVELGVPREIDNTHATAAELVEYLVATEASAAGLDSEHLGR